MDFLTLAINKDGSTIDVVVNDKRKPLIAFPTKEVAAKAVEWCQGKKMSSSEAADALIKHCKVKGVRQVGKGLPKVFGALAGVKCYKIELGDLKRVSS
jgi:hypothetical protein